MSDYQGLSAYQQRAPADPLARRPSESVEAHRRRTGPYQAVAVEDEQWAEHRGIVDQQATGTGLFGRATPKTAR